MYKEFKLVSSKWIFRLEDMTEGEQRLWTEHLAREGFEIDDPREIFEPFEGEPATYLNEMIATQELRVREWKWNNGEEHTLLDINAWPGDNESGVVAFNGVAVISNSDQYLDWIDDHIPEFEGRLEFFREIRKYLGNGHKCRKNDLVKEYNLFFEHNGKEAIAVEQAAWCLYCDELEEIREKHRLLRNKYLHEFRVLDSTCDAVNGLGYNGKVDKNTRFIFVEWIPQEVKLVTVSACFDNNTYLLKDGIIDEHVYKSVYLSDTLKTTALAKRIHSYLAHAYNRD